MTGRRVLGIGLDPYTIDFDSDFFRGKPLKRRRDRGRDQGERGAHSLRMAADRRARRGGGGEGGGPRGTGGAAGGGGSDRRRCPARSCADAGAGSAGERGDRPGPWGAGGVQYLANRNGGGDWAGLRAWTPCLDAPPGALRHVRIVAPPGSDGSTSTVEGPAGTTAAEDRVSRRGTGTRVARPRSPRGAARRRGRARQGLSRRLPQPGGSLTGPWRTRDDRHGRAARAGLFGYDLHDAPEWGMESPS